MRARAIISGQPIATAARLLSGAQAVFWVYSIAYIIRSANPKGDGMELVAVMPMTLVFAVFVIPALMLSFFTRLHRVGVTLGVIGACANGFLWNEILAELGGRG